MRCGTEGEAQQANVVKSRAVVRLPDWKNDYDIHDSFNYIHLT